VSETATRLRFDAGLEAALAFRSLLEEAVDAVRAIESDHAAAAHEARAIAEDVFGTAVALPALLRVAGA